MVDRDSDEPVESQVFYRIRKIITHHQEWADRQYGTYCIRDTWPVAWEVMSLIDQHYQLREISYDTEE